MRQSAKLSNRSESATSSFDTPLLLAWLRLSGGHTSSGTRSPVRQINAGASVKDIADLLGHRSIDTTAIYAKVDPLLPNSRGGHMTRSEIEHQLRLLLEIAAKKDPTLAQIHLSPHAMRHTTAMHLLQSGVDLSVIAMWLGHEDLETMHQYLDADLETKKRALDRLPSPSIRRPRQKGQPRLVEFLRRL